MQSHGMPCQAFHALHATHACHACLVWYGMEEGSRGGEVGEGEQVTQGAKPTTIRRPSETQSEEAVVIMNRGADLIFP